MEDIRRSARDTKRSIPSNITHALQKTMRKLSSGNNEANQVFSFPKYSSKMRKILPYLQLYG